MEFKLLDIDNNKIRKLLQADKTIDIKYVPCIISVDFSGVASKYEARDAFELIYKLIEPAPDPKQYPTKSHPTKSHPLPNVVFKQKNDTPVLPEPIAPEVLQPSTTSIETLLDLNEEEEQEQEQEVSVKLKKNKGKINISSVMKNAEIEERKNTHQPQAQHQAVQTPVQTGKKVSVSEIMESRQ